MPTINQRRARSNALFSTNKNQGTSVNQNNRVIRNVQDDLAAEGRRGTMYFLASLNIERVPVSLNRLANSAVTSSFDNFVVGSEPIQDLLSTGYVQNIWNSGPMEEIKSGATNLLNSANNKARELSQKLKQPDCIKNSRMVQKIRETISSFWSTFVRKVKEVYGPKCQFVSEWLAEAGAWLVTNFSDMLANCIPGWGYVQNASDIYSGIKKACKSGYKFISQIYTGRGVSLASGQPSDISRALAQHSAIGVFGGLKDATVGILSICADLAIDSVSGVGSMVFELVKGIFENLISLIDFFAQRYMLRKAINKAREAWANKDSRSSLINNPNKFSLWFRYTVTTTPIVAALMMESGLIAHPNKFLLLIDAKSRVITQSKFNKGVKYIEKLKSLSREYVQEYTDGYDVEFSSSVGFINSRLTELQEGKRLLSIVDGPKFQGVTGLSGASKTLIAPKTAP